MKCLSLRSCPERVWETINSTDRKRRGRLQPARYRTVGNRFPAIYDIHFNQAAFSLMTTLRQSPQLFGKKLIQ